MNLKMMVTDLDGTLLRQDKTISSYTEAMLNRCKEQGLIIAIATARPPRSVAVLSLPSVFDAIIYHNGAIIDVAGKTFAQYGISLSTAEHIVSALLQLDANIRIAAEIKDAFYANFDTTTVWGRFPSLRTDFKNLSTSFIDKFCLPIESLAEFDKIKKILPQEVYAVLSERNMVMIMNKKAVKGEALRQLAHHYAIELKDIVAFGDDHNDIEMLTQAGQGIAMANAIAEAKAVANGLCDSNENDGVAKWLEHNYLRL